MLAGYHRVISSIYSPEMFYQRVLNLMRGVQSPCDRCQFRTLTKFRAFLRSLVVLGVLSAERCYYWKLFFKTLFTAPRKFPLAITMAVYGYHFRKLTEKIIRETAPSKKRRNMPDRKWRLCFPLCRKKPNPRPNCLNDICACLNS